MTSSGWLRAVSMRIGREVAGRAQALADLEAVDLRQPHVEQDQVEARRRRAPLERLRAVARELDGVALALEVEHQPLRRSPPRPRRPGCAAARARRLTLAPPPASRQRRPRSGCPAGPPASTARTVPRISSTRPATIDRPRPVPPRGADISRPSLVEAVEDASQLVLRDADAVVLDLDARRRRRRRATRQRTSPPGCEKRTALSIRLSSTRRSASSLRQDRRRRSPRRPRSADAAALDRAAAPRRGSAPKNAPGRPGSSSSCACCARQQPAALEHVVDQRAHAVGLLHDVARASAPLGRGATSAACSVCACSLIAASGDFISWVTLETNSSCFSA